PAGTAIGVGGYRIGEQAGAFHENCRRTIDACKQARINRARDSGAERGDISAEIGPRAYAQGEKMTFRVERKLGLSEVIAALVVRQKTFGTPRRPAHRTVEPARGPGDDRLLGIELALVSEAAADIGRNHAQRALTDTELLGHQ